ncbi:hypothetical protein [Pyruvatibacter sp.]|uniref:hypothetical protein n=1 Tax=Pyruvatibacter sp. TaxID=1981328 RepID=UPI0032631173
MLAAKWIFRIAGIYGLLVITPLFFADTSQMAEPVYYLGFAGIAFAFQILFLVISTDPVRYRPIMPVCVLEKLSTLPFIYLYLVGRGDEQFFFGGIADQVMAIAFIVAFLMTPKRDAA